MQAMVSAPQPEAVEAGLDILAAGGNVVDAAIGAALVQTAVDPQMCGIAGFGSMHLHLPERGVHELIDFHGRAPLATRPDMWADLILGECDDGFGFMLRDHKAAGDILGYTPVNQMFRADRNSPEDIRLGHLTVNIGIEPAPAFKRADHEIRRYRPAVEGLVSEIIARLNAIA